MEIVIDVLNGPTPRYLELSLVGAEDGVAKLWLKPEGPGSREIQVDLDELTLAMTALRGYRNALR